MAPEAPLEMHLCQHCKKYRASGIFTVWYKIFRTVQAKNMYLCAACGFFGIGNRMRIFVPKDSATPVGFKDVVKVSLLQSI